MGFALGGEGHITAMATTAGGAPQEVTILQHKTRHDLGRHDNPRNHNQAQNSIYEGWREVEEEYYRLARKNSITGVELALFRDAWRLDSFLPHHHKVILLLLVFVFFCLYC